MGEKRRAWDGWTSVRNDLFADTIREGVVKGKQDALLIVLVARGLSISRLERVAILASDGPAELDRWLARACKAGSVEQLLADVPARTGCRARRKSAEMDATRRWEWLTRVRLAEASRERMTGGHEEREGWRGHLVRDLFVDAVIEGETQGKRDALLLVLEGRGLPVTRAQRAAILGCDDLVELDRWLTASVKAASVPELLAEVPAPKKTAARHGTARHRAVRVG